MSLPWPIWSPVPQDWNREFFFYHGDYEFDPIAGRTLFRIGGVTREDNTVLLELHGHHPHCYFKADCDLDRARDLVAYWESRARSTGYVYFGPRGRWIYDQVADATRWVLGVSARVCVDMIEDRPAERVGARFRVDFAHPSLVKMFREYALYCFGREADPRVPTWCEDGNRLRLFSRMLVYEANVDYVERVVADRQWPPGAWYRVKHWDRCRRARARQNDYDESGKRYDMVIRASVEDVEPTGDETPHATRVLAYDIEAENQDGDHMPRAADDAVLDIVVYAYRDGQREHAASFAFELGTCDSVVDKVFYYDDDRELLAQFRKFVILSRCDAICAHNGNGFDLPYMIERAKALGLKGWDYLGPLRRKARITTTVNKGFKKHNAFAPGMLVVDTMRIEQETLGARGLSLADCAIRYLDNKLKMDVHPDEISRLQETHGGRSKKHKYCARDAELVMDIEQSQRGIEGALKMARRSIPAQTVMNRSQGAKGEGFIARAAMASDPPQIMLVLSFMQRLLRDRPRARVRGDYEGSKEYEGALNLPPVPLYVAPTGGPRRKVVFIFDFSGLYPSIIRRRNISPDTELRADTIAMMDYREGEHYWSSPDYEDDPATGRMRVVPVAENPKFVRSSVRRGLLPLIQDQLAADRKVVKARLAEVQVELQKDDLPDARRKDLKRVEAQLSLEERTIKLLMNSIYGLMARLKSGDAEGGSGMIHSIRYVSMAVASTVTREGRGLIMQSRDIIHDEFPGAKVVGGDTDSIFPLVETGDDEEAYCLGMKMEETLNSHFEFPIHIALEGMAVAFEQYRKKNYKKLVRDVHPNGGWKKPRLVVKGESWIKRNFPRNLRKACQRVADVLLTAEAQPDRYEAAIAAIREEVRRLVDRKVPVGDLVESSKLSQDLKDYDNLGKGPAMLKRQYEAAVATAKRKRDAEPRAAGRKKRAIDVYQPEAGAIASFIIAPPSEGAKKITQRAVPAFDAIRQNLRYDRDYYVDQLYKTVSSSFGQALVTLSSREGEVDAAARARRLEFERKIRRLREARPESLSLDEKGLLWKTRDPRRLEKEAAMREQDMRKKKYLEITREIAGVRVDPEPPTRGAGVLAFFGRKPLCRECGLEACGCDHGAAREAKRAELAETREARRKAWAKCAECVGGAADEAERCRSYRSCANFSWRSHLDFEINRINREIADVEDLMLNSAVE